LIRIALFAAYLLLAHLSVLRQAPWLQVVAITLLSTSLLYRQLRERREAWLMLAALAAATLGLVYGGGGQYAICVPSVVLLSMAGYGFFNSLRPGHTPLITRMAAGSRQPLTPEVTAYTRGLTWWWGLLIAAVLAVNLYLIAAAPLSSWSRYANGYVYLIFGLFFAAEYAWRCLRFRGTAQPGLLDYLRLLARHRAGLT